jgi:predicted HicB family RNase H-like nuclease
MRYNSYTARVEFDERDNIFWGKVLGINDSITFEGETVAQLTEDFHNAIDFYLADCAALGKSPDKPASGKLLLRVPPEIHAAALIKAQAAGKSLNQWASEVLGVAVEHSHQ